MSKDGSWANRIVLSVAVRKFEQPIYVYDLPYQAPISLLHRNVESISSIPVSQSKYIL